MDANGKPKTVIKHKKWGNVKERFQEIDHLPFIGSKGYDSHVDREDRLIGFSHDWKLVEPGVIDEHGHVFGHQEWFDDIKNLSDLPDPSNLPVSIGFDDIAPPDADYQDIAKLHHLAVSLNNLERDRCSTVGGMACNVSNLTKEEIEQNIAEIQYKINLLKKTDFRDTDDSPRYPEPNSHKNTGSDGTGYGQNIITDMEESDMGDNEQWMQGAVKKEGSFRAWCKSKGLVNKDGTVTQACIEAGKKSKDPLVRKRATLAETFHKYRPQQRKDFTFHELEDFDQILSTIIELENESMGNEEVHDFTDHSIAAQEKAISDCMKKGGSREECTEKVKKKMNKDKELDGDMTEEEIEEEESETTDTVEVCSKEYDMLKEKAQKYDELKKEHDEFKEDFKKFKADFDEILKEREAELEEKRQEKVKELCTDFDIPEEEIKDDSMEELLKLEKRLDFALKRKKTEDYEEDLDDTIDTTKDMAEAIVNKYRIPV